MPLASVVIPTYNRPAKLERALLTALNQTLTDIEVFVVNDCGDEKSVLQVINRLDDPRIYYLRNQRTKGGNGARNTGILHAKGKYIALLDDDDEWMPQKLEKQIMELSRRDQSYAGCFCAYKILKNSKWEDRLYAGNENMLTDYLLSRFSLGSASSLLFTKSSINRVGLFDEELERHQDIHFLVVFLRYYNLVYVNEILFKVHGHNEPPAHKLEKVKPILFKKIKKEILTLHKDDINTYYAKQYRSLGNLFSKEGNIIKTTLYLTRSIFYRPLNLTNCIETILASIDVNKGCNLTGNFKTLRDRAGQSLIMTRLIKLIHRLRQHFL